MATKPKYNGFFNEANEPETRNWVEVFASDWEKEQFAFYAYIDLETYKQDIDNINNLIGELNYLDQDVYVELINYGADKEHKEKMEKFYSGLYEEGYFAHWNALDPRKWRKFWGF